jgi:hypothetical protein
MGGAVGRCAVPGQLAVMLLRTMKTFHCEQCNQVLFFENTVCVGCGRLVGFAPDVFDMRNFGEGTNYRQCLNYSQQQVCNWLLGAQEQGDLCRSCDLTAVIPDLTLPGNHEQWFRMESAKRRMVYTLLSLRLPLVTRKQEPEFGLEFQFKSDAGLPPEAAVLTGHDNGVITLNLSEADDAERERRRVQLHEPYRTLLGHFRHEIGHYYWDRLIPGDKWTEPFRALFGDERLDYAEALKAHYAAGDKPTWEQGYISAYATAHPWEDWAESWAHYLHMVDGLETAAALGMKLSPARADEPALKAPTSDPTSASFERLHRDWAALTYALNNLNRSMGLNDAYPFVVSQAALGKLEFVHQVIADAQSALPGS